MKELYELKNGDLYCVLESEEKIGLSQLADWVTPDGEIPESTDGAVKEIRFRGKLPWEWEPMDPGFKQNTFLFTLSRSGVNEEGISITQNCREISFYGKTKNDKLGIWEKGQKVKKAPEEIEKEAVRMYIENGQRAKALRECEAMGWKDYGKIFEEVDGMVQIEDTTFEGDGDSVTEW